MKAQVPADETDVSYGVGISSHISPLHISDISGSTMANRIFPSILGSMLPALDLENRDDALVTSSYAIQVPAPHAGVLVDVARPALLAFSDNFQDL